MYTCSSCAIHACRDNNLDKAPSNCPCMDEDMEKIKELYTLEDDRAIAYKSACVESEGYCRKTRLEEIMDFAKKCGYKNLGIAFCIGLSKEAKVLSQVLAYNGFEVNSVACKSGSVPKEFIDIKEDEKVNPGKFEPMCNPIGQAFFLDKSGTDLNIILGLCVGHDTLFIKHSKAPVTVFAAKDRVLAHNPLAAIYQAEAYYKKKLFPQK